MVHPIIGCLIAGCVTLNLFNFEDNTYYDMSANPIILDMDFCTDVDDAVAVRMATVLDSAGVGTLKAVGLCTTDEDGNNMNVKAVHGILSYAGYKDIPIGTAHVEEPDNSPYWDVCASYSDGEINAEDAVELYKEVLSSCANPVTIVTTGYVTNIEHLLRDEEGYELVAENCAKIVITGGTYLAGWDNNFGYTSNAANAIKYVDENAPCEIVYVANDVGGPFTAGGIIQESNPEDPVAKALSAWGTDSGRAAWDPTAVFIAYVPMKVSNFNIENITTQFYSNGEHVWKVTEEDTGRTVVRRKDNITLNQYKQMIEGILAMSYSEDT